MTIKKTAWMEKIANGEIPKNKHLAILLSLLPPQEKRTLELRAKICNDAAMYGTINTITRELYLKYNNYLIKLNNGSK